MSVIWILRILAAPIVAALAIFIAFCTFLLALSATILGVISSIIGILGIFALLVGEVSLGIQILIFAFVISPVGLPLLAAWLLGRLQALRYAIQDRIYG